MLEPERARIYDSRSPDRGRARDAAYDNDYDRPRTRREGGDDPLPGAGRDRLERDIYDRSTGDRYATDRDGDERGVRDRPGRDRDPRDSDSHVPLGNRDRIDRDRAERDRVSLADRDRVERDRGIRTDRDRGGIADRDRVGRDRLGHDAQSRRPESVSGSDDARDAVAVGSSSRLIASNKVEGAAVYALDGERLGSVYNFMIDKHSGRVDYVVMTYGGFLGMGTRYYPMPWQVLKYDTRRNGYRVDLTARDLETAPSFGRDNEPNFNRDYGDRVYNWYGLNY